MSKMIGRIGLWSTGVICMVLICVKMIVPVIETELINSENYQMTPELKTGDVIEQSVTLKREGLNSIGVAFAYAENTQDASKVLVQIVADEEPLVQSVMQVNLIPNQSFTTFKVSGNLGDTLTLRITNISEKDFNTQFALLYTDSQVRMLDHVSQYEINNQMHQGQLISQYSYKAGYDYYEAFSAVFWVFLMCIILENVLLKKCKEEHDEN